MTTNSAMSPEPPPQASRGPAPLPAAKAPVGPGTISLLGLLWSMLLLGVGVVGVQAALVAAGLLHGTSWLTWIIQQFDGLTASAWMVPAGLVLVLLGLWLVTMALRPGRRPR